MAKQPSNELAVALASIGAQLLALAEAQSPSSSAKRTSKPATKGSARKDKAAYKARGEARSRNTQNGREAWVGEAKPAPHPSSVVCHPKYAPKVITAETDVHKLGKSEGAVRLHSLWYLTPNGTDTPTITKVLTPFEPAIEVPKRIADRDVQRVHCLCEERTFTRRKGKRAGETFSRDCWFLAFSFADGTSLKVNCGDDELANGRALDLLQAVRPSLLGKPLSYGRKGAAAAYTLGATLKDDVAVEAPKVKEFTQVTILATDEGDGDPECNGRVEEASCQI